MTADRPTGTGRLGNLVFPSGVQVGWQRDAACKDASDPDEFFPEKSEDGEAAKQVCASCPVMGECLEFALATMTATGRDHGVYGGLTPAERARLRGGPVLVRAPRLDSRAQVVIGRRLTRQLGMDAAARALGVTPEALTDAWRSRQSRPTPSRPSQQVAKRQAAKREVAEPQAAKREASKREIAEGLYRDRAMAEQALALASEIGIRRAVFKLGVTHGALYRAWRHHGLDRPAHEVRRRAAASLRAAAGSPADGRRRSHGRDGREEVGDRDRR